MYECATSVAGFGCTDRHMQCLGPVAVHHPSYIFIFTYPSSPFRLLYVYVNMARLWGLGLDSHGHHQTNHTRLNIFQKANERRLYQNLNVFFTFHIICI